jgi:drug/metabolite transporter (DMT)-like permease
MALVTAAFLVLPVLDGIAKILIADIHLVQVVWARLFFQSIAVVFWLAIIGRLKSVRSERPLLLTGTVCVIWVANFPIIFALSYLPLADAFALIMTAPLMVMALSVPLLREKVSGHNWLVVMVGFCGALVVIRPGFGVFQWAAVLPVLSAAFFALFQIGVRQLTPTHSPIDLLFFVCVGPLIATSALVGFFWTTPDGFSWLLMVLMGLGAGVGQFLLIAALKYSPASLLAPFTYIQLISGTIFGIIVFGDFPDTFTIAGAVIIVGSGIYAMVRGFASTDVTHSSRD